MYQAVCYACEYVSNRYERIDAAMARVRGHVTFGGCPLAFVIDAETDTI